MFSLENVSEEATFMHKLNLTVSHLIITDQDELIKK